MKERNCWKIISSTAILAGTFWGLASQVFAEDEGTRFISKGTVGVEAEALLPDEGSQYWVANPMPDCDWDAKVSLSLMGEASQGASISWDFSIAGAVSGADKEFKPELDIKELYGKFPLGDNSVLVAGRMVHNYSTAVAQMPLSIILTGQWENRVGLDSVGLQYSHGGSTVSVYGLLPDGTRDAKLLGHVYGSVFQTDMNLVCLDSAHGTAAGFSVSRYTGDNMEVHGEAALPDISKVDGPWTYALGTRLNTDDGKGLMSLEYSDTQDDDSGGQVTLSGSWSELFKNITPTVSATWTPHDGGMLIYPQLSCRLNEAATLSAWVKHYCGDPLSAAANGPYSDNAYLSVKYNF